MSVGNGVSCSLITSDLCLVHYRIAFFDLVFGNGVFNQSTLVSVLIKSGPGMFPLTVYFGNRSDFITQLCSICVQAYSNAGRSLSILVIIVYPYLGYGYGCLFRGVFIDNGKLAADNLACLISNAFLVCTYITVSLFFEFRSIFSPAIYN